MAQSITSTGKTIDQAIENALHVLNKTKDEVDINITQQPENGVFGFFGRKDAIVEVTVREETPRPVVTQVQETVVPEQEVLSEEVVEATPQDVVEIDQEQIVKEKEAKAIDFLNNMFKAMNLDVDIDSHFDGEFLRIDLSGPKMGILIGRRGQTLDAIQYLTSLAINKNSDEYTRLILDTENYRDKRKQTLENLADKMANKAVRFRRRVSLEPMNPAERRIIHSRLQNNRNVYTYSEGQDPYRRVVIQLNSNR